MAIDENFLLSKIMDLNSSIASISGKIDGFLQMQSAQQTEITTIKGRLTDVETDIDAIKQTHTVLKTKFLTVTTICAAGAAGFMTFAWPFLRQKIGL